MCAQDGSLTMGEDHEAELEEKVQKVDMHNFWSLTTGVMWEF